MNIIRSVEHAVQRGPANWFTGTVWLHEMSRTGPVARVRVLRVTFEPGARTAWHTHPHGQVLHILSGLGRVQREGGPVTEVFPGDTVWFEPNERHWHGAGPNSLMAHLAVQQPDAAGNATTWLEHVTDAEYNGK